MKTENQNCCFCFHIASGGNTVTSDILALLKFLIGNLNINAVENSPICDGCLNKILEICEYKRKNSMKMLVETKKEVDCEKPVICQKCNSLCEEGHSLLLTDCITQIDWSDFVNYLFPDQDSQSVESLQVCGSCQISVSNIQDFLKLIYVHDQSNKMKCDINNCDDINATGNENLMREKVEIKQEFGHFMDDKTEIQNIIEDNKAKIKHLAENIKVEMICIDGKDDGDITYSDFKCKNEEVELKLDNEDSYVNPSIDRYEKLDGTDLTTGDATKNNFNNEEDQGIQDLKCIYCSKEFAKKSILDNHLRINKCKNGITRKIHKCSLKATKKCYLLHHELKHGEVAGLQKFKCQQRNFKCALCSKCFTQRQTLDDHLLQVHKNKDGVVSKIHECDICSYLTTKKWNLLKHKLKHGIPVGLEKYKCQHCIYETYNRAMLITHTKTHNNIRDFKCSLCSKCFTKRQSLDDHLLKVHKNKDDVTSKIHECDRCSYSTTKNEQLLIHKIKHGVTVEDPEKYNCQHCTYETIDKDNLIAHMITHNTQDFKCTLFSKNVIEKNHNNKNTITSKIHKCGACSYETISKSQLLKHKLTHCITAYDKSNLSNHIKTHNILDFKCTLCLKKFTTRRYLDDHILKIHKNKDSVVSKIHECDRCSYSTTRNDHLLKHKLKHGIVVELEKYKCQHCIYATYNKNHLIKHIKIHNYIKDFKCTLCTKKFTEKRNLDNHLLKSHNSKGNVTSKIHECDICSYKTTINYRLLLHKLKHGIKKELENHNK